MLVSTRKIEKMLSRKFLFQQYPAFANQKSSNIQQIQSKKLIEARQFAILACQINSIFAMDVRNTNQIILVHLFYAKNVSPILNL